MSDARRRATIQLQRFLNRRLLSIGLISQERYSLSEQALLYTLTEHDKDSIIK